MGSRSSWFRNRRAWAHFIDVASRSVVANVLVDTRPRVAEFRPGDKQVWVSSEVGGSVTIIDAASRQITGKIGFAIPAVRPELISPVGVRFTADGKTAFVALGRANRVAVVDADTLKVRKYLLVGDRECGNLFYRGTGARSMLRTD